MSAMPSTFPRERNRRLGYDPQEVDRFIAIARAEFVAVTRCGLATVRLSAANPHNNNARLSTATPGAWRQLTGTAKRGRSKAGANAPRREGSVSPLMNQP